VGSKLPFVALDCETDPFKVGRVPQPFLWGLYDGQTDEYLEFATAEDVVAYLYPRRCIVYAHNGGKFDYHYLRDHINSDDPVMVIAGRLARFKIGDAEFRDSINVLVNPLRAFAKEEIDYSKLEADVRQQHLDEIRAYLRSDCVNLWVTLKRYFDKYGRTLTQAGASMKYWRKHYPCDMRPQTAMQSLYYRDFYFGGRVQCFESGHAQCNFRVIDKNSAYPDAMLRKHPISPEGVLIEHLPGDSDKLGPCLIRVDAVAHGCFPLRHDDDSLFFPDDEHTIREYCITGWELMAALETGTVRVFNIKEIRQFSQVIDFAEYIGHFYGERQTAKLEGDKMRDVFAKLFMNSLYGKFAANPEKYYEYVITHPETLDRWCNATEGYLPIKPWGSRTLCARSLPESKHRYYNVATAASITGFVRAELWKAICQCSGVLYCDTDSIAARQVQNLRMGDQLGEWKLELVGEQFAIAGKKLYAFFGHKENDQLWECLDYHGNKTKDIKGWKTASKGVRLTPEQIVQVAKGETIEYVSDVPTYSFQRDEPIFIPRVVQKTFKDIRKMQ
jgi:hypothetical protein